LIFGSSYLKKEISFHFKNILKTRKGVEQNNEIIGEAIVRILKADPGFQITDSRKTVDTRNRIIHVYEIATDDVTKAHSESSLASIRAKSKKIIKIDSLPSDLSVFRFVVVLLQKHGHLLRDHSRNRFSFNEFSPDFSG